MTIEEPARRPMAPGQFLFALTVVLSAFLLFQVQPLLAKFILPWFGGSPAVWTAAMLFFQMTLFAGYAYAHAIVRFLPTKAQVTTHIVVLVVACSLLPIIPSETWKGHTAENPTWTICGLLATAVGLPYFSLSATGPLLQAWYYKWRADGSPYRLYALSNAGSLAGLLTYPLIVEPNWRLKVQANSWSLGFGLFAACCALTGLLVGRAAKSTNTVAPVSQSTSATAISWRRRLSWLGLSMLGSSLLLATTNHVCQDVAVVPFLWVIPLTLYLLTFIVCFDRPAWYSRKWIPAISVAWIVATVSPDIVNDMLQGSLGLTFTGFNLVSLAGFSFIAMFLGCVVSHGELRRLAPPPEKLTEFYLFMSAGGALGGMFVSLLAPVVFKDFYEWPLTLGICVLVSLAAVWQEFRPVEQESRSQWLVRTVIACGLGSLVLFQIVRAEIPSTPPLSFERNFYGVVIVREPEVDAGEDPYRVIVNGGIQHGRQYLTEEKRRLPLSYYGPNTGAGQILLKMKQKEAARVGVVGLGIGTIAAYAEPTHHYRFYEINPIVDTAARKYFTYLSDCRGHCETVLGDARLVMERETPMDYDVLVLDAFSGDAVPTHLLTREAFEIFLKHVKPDGVIAVHITNSYLALDPVVAAVAESHGLHVARVETKSDTSHGLFRTRYMLLTRNPAQLADVAEAKSIDRSTIEQAHLWTDDFSDLLSVVNKR